MIQVIQKVFKTLELLNSKEGRGLNQLALETKINKGTLCNILKTLVELGYVSKEGNGNYLISKKFYQIAYPFSKTERISELADKFSTLLATQTMESGVVSTLHGSQVRIVAQAQYNRSLMVNPEVYKDLSLYHSVSGRVLLSFLEEDELKEITEAAGMPGSAWDDAYDLKCLAKAARQIKDAGMSVMENTSTEIKAFAVPVMDSDMKICAALGLTVPMFRLTAREEKKIVATLKKNAALLGDTLRAESIYQQDWFQQ